MICDCAKAVLPLLQVRKAVLAMSNRKTFDTAYGHAFVRCVTLPFAMRILTVQVGAWLAQGGNSLALAWRVLCAVVESP